MKYVKKFESYNIGDLPDSAKDMFDLWNDIVFDSYKIIDDPKDLDWDKTDIIERHDHQVEWAAEAYDEDDFLWYVTIDVMDGHFEEVNYDSLELESDSVGKMVNLVFDKVREIDPSAVNRKVEMEMERFGKKITIKKILLEQISPGKNLLIYSKRFTLRVISIINWVSLLSC